MADSERMWMEHDVRFVRDWSVILSGSLDRLGDRGLSDASRHLMEAADSLSGFLEGEGE